MRPDLVGLFALGVGVGLVLGTVLSWAAGYTPRQAEAKVTNQVCQQLGFTDGVYQGGVVYCRHLSAEVHRLGPGDRP